MAAAAAVVAEEEGEEEAVVEVAVDSENDCEYPPSFLLFLLFFTYCLIVFLTA